MLGHQIRRTGLERVQREHELVHEIVQEKRSLRMELCRHAMLCLREQLDDLGFREQAVRKRFDGGRETGRRGLQKPDGALQIHVHRRQRLTQVMRQVGDDALRRRSRVR